jgi:hypothetical protein
MKFDPGTNDRELLELISIAIRIPCVRLGLVAKLEQLMELYKDEIREQIVRESQPVVPLQGAPFPPGPVSNELADGRADDLPVPREYGFRLVKEQGAWVQDREQGPGALYLLMPEVIDYIVSELAMVKRVKDQGTVIATGPGFRFLSISARRVSGKEICGSLTDLNENPYRDEAGQGENRVGDNVVFINMANFSHSPDQERIYRMIDYINVDPDLKRSLLDYFYLILEPLLGSKSGLACKTRENS